MLINACISETKITLEKISLIYKGMMIWKIQALLITFGGLFNIVGTYVRTAEPLEVHVLIK